MVNNNISWGIDNIPAELRKSGILNEQLLHICNYVDSQQEIDTWKKKSTLHYSPQNEGLLLTTNYRGITLTPIAAKIDPKLKNRIRPFLLALLRKNQYGFRKQSHWHLYIRRITDATREKQLPAVVVFTDFSKAFDSIDCPEMEKILMVYGISEKTSKASIMMHSFIQAFTPSPDWDTEYFNILGFIESIFDVF